MQTISSVPGKYLLLALLFSATAYSQTPVTLRGEMRMHSAVVETACSVGAESVEQQVVMKDISIGELIRDGYSEPHPFSIKLENCSVALPGSPVASRTAFQITFDGPADGNNFALSGDSQGIALQITDDRGFQSHPGVPMPPHNIPDGQHTLNYTLRAVGNGYTLSSGNHYSSLRYRLDYY